MSDKKDPNAKKRVYISDDKKKELEGFEDVFDLIDKVGVQVKTKKKEVQIEDYEIYDFLEKEVTRLEKLDQFFTVQMPLEKKYHQTRGLIQKESTELHLIKDELIDKVSTPGSRLGLFLNDLIKRSY